MGLFERPLVVDWKTAPRTKTAASLGAVFAILMISSATRAQSPADGPALTYDVPEGCPLEATFVREVRARCGACNEAQIRAALARISVFIRRTDKNLQAKLEWSNGGSRLVVGQSCLEIVQALALVVALHEKTATEGSTSGEPRIDSEHLLSVAQQAETPQQEKPEIDGGAAARSTDSVGLRPAMRLGVDAFRVRPVASPRSPRWFAGAAGILAFGPAPGAMGGGEVFIEHRPKARWQQSYLLGVDFTPPREASVEDAVARFQWWASRMDACLAASAFRRGLRLWICAEAVGGVTIAQGVQTGPITHPRTSYQGWLSVGPAARLHFSMPGCWSIEVAGGVGYPFVRHRTEFTAPDRAFPETDFVAGFMLLRVSYGFGGSDRVMSAIANW